MKTNLHEVQPSPTASAGRSGGMIPPETFRLPKSGERDPHFGPARSSFYELEAAGNIHLVRLRKRGNARGITLVPYDDVLAFLNGCRNEVVRS